MVIQAAMSFPITAIEVYSIHSIKRYCMAAVSSSLEPIPCASEMRSVPDTVACNAEESVEEQQQLTPHDLWIWNDEFHWKHWHGVWVHWQPLESSEVTKTYRTVRSLRADNEERTRLYHRNQWYAAAGSGEDFNWEFGPWIMTEETHSLPDGILHPNKDDFRILQFPNGDLAWLQLALKPDDPKCVVFGEVHFMLPTKDGRVPVILGYDKDDKLGAAQMLEETRDSDEKPDPSWEGTVWKHHRSPLDKSREEPDGKFVGKEMILTPSLLMTTREAEWTGFKGGLNQEDAEEYTLIHFPYNFTALCPKKAAVGKEHAFVVHWIASEDEVRMISWRYGADGKLQHAKSGTYTRQSR